MSPENFKTASAYLFWLLGKAWALCKRYPLIPIIAVALVLRLSLLGNARLWYDEAGSVWMATLPYAKMVAATASDIHPPAFLSVLWLWTRIAGTSEIAVRFPSAIFSTLCIPLTFAIARRLNLSSTVALVASALVAILPAELYYAQEARMYALLILAVNLALWAALARRWVIFGLALLLGYYTHNYGLIFGIGLNLVAVWAFVTAYRCQPWKDAIPELSMWVTVNLLAFGLWLPWAVALAGQLQIVNTYGYWLQGVTPGTILYVLYMIVWAFAPGPLFQAHAALLLFGALVFALTRAIWKRNTAALLCAGFVAAPFVIAGTASVLWKPIVLFRAFLPASIPLCILLAWAFTDGLSRQRRIIIAMLALPSLLVGSVLYYTNVTGLKGDSLILNVIKWQPGDIVYHVNDSSLVIAHPYLPEAWPQYELPQDGWWDIGAMNPQTRVIFGFNQKPLESLQWRRAWLVYAASPMTAKIEDEAVAQILKDYVYEVVYERREPMAFTVIYLIWNYRLGKGVG
jgi:hypothetical protein